VKLILIAFRKAFENHFKICKMRIKSATENTKNKILKIGNISMYIFLGRLRFSDIRFSGFVYFVV